jgi:hypothetical protein
MADFFMIVYFAVKHDDNIVALRDDWLIAALKINNLQTRVAKANAI